MEQFAKIEFMDIPKDDDYISTITEVVNKCFKEEQLENTNLYISITLTNPENIRKINKKYRNIDKETDVLSFPMFEKQEIQDIIKLDKHEVIDILGDIIISVERVKAQSIEYGHSFKRELSYMVVHGFYHLMGYDHLEEEDKLKMRKKEENVLQKLKIIRT